MRPIWLIGVVAAGAAALTVLAAVERGPYAVDQADDRLGGPPVSTTGSAVAVLQRIGGREDYSELIGQRVELVVDIGQAANDVAFWTGSPPDELLVVIARDKRSARERLLGLPPHNAMTIPMRGTAVVRGDITPLPYAEAMFSWGLTRRDVALVQEREVYLRVDEVVSVDVARRRGR